MLIKKLKYAKNLLQFSLLTIYDGKMVNLITILTDAHKEIIRLYVTMDQVLVVHCFNEADHLKEYHHTNGIHKSLQIFHNISLKRQQILGYILCKKKFQA